MFRGATSLSLDAKGRLAVPTRHREALLHECAGHLVLTAHPHRCLLLYPSPALQRLLVGFAEDIAMDSAGRVLVSPVLRDFAGLTKEVMLVGQGSHFELWNMEAWREQLAQVMQGDGLVMPAELEGFSL